MLFEFQQSLMPDITTPQLAPCLAQAELPMDPEAPGPPTLVHLSPNTAHVAVCWASGALAVYEVGWRGVRCVCASAAAPGCAELSLSQRCTQLPQRRRWQPAAWMWMLL